MIKLVINSLERKRMLYYAEHSLFGKAHWGDGEVLIPEEKMLFEYFKQEDEFMEITFTQLKILIQWFLESTNNGAFLINEDIVILKKLIAILELYYKENNIDRIYESEDVPSAITFIKTIFNNTDSMAK